jgi:MFS family permease
MFHVEPISRTTRARRLPGVRNIDQARSGPPRTLLAVLLAAPFLSSVDATIANVATPAIRTSLGASGAAAELIIGGYLIAYATLMITGARLGQTCGYRRMFLLGMASFAVTSLLAGVAPDAGALVAARVLQGAAAALMFPQAMTGIRLTYAGHARARAIGWYAIALSVGAVVGQLGGGLLVDANLADIGWRAIFLVNVPVCLGVLAAARRRLPGDGERVAAGLDLPGVGLLAGSVLLIVLPLVVGQQQGWPAWAWICLAASVPGLWLFLTTERRAAAAGRPVLVNLTAVRPAPVALGLIALAAATSTYYALLFTLAQYEQQGLGRSPVASGLILVPWVVAFGQAGRLAPRVPARMARALPTVGCALLTLAYTAISLSLFGGGQSELLLLVLLAVGGFGLGLQFATLIGHVMNAVEARFAADVSGVSSTLSQLGGAIGVAGIGSLYLAIARDGDPARATHAAAIAIAAMAAVSLVAALAAYRATRPRAPIAGRTASTDMDTAREQPTPIETGAA